MTQQRQSQPRDAVQTAQAMLHRLDERDLLRCRTADGDSDQSDDKDQFLMDDLNHDDPAHADSFARNGKGALPLYLSFTLLTTRILLAALFLFSGLAKLGFLGTEYGNSPLEFATAIRKFQLVQYDLIPELAFIIPWVEVVCGLALLLGLAARGSAVLLNLLLASFTIGMILVLLRGIEIPACGCFGGKITEFSPLLGAVLEPPVGFMSIGRNVVLMGLCFFIACKGPGCFSFDAISARRRGA